MGSSPVASIHISPGEPLFMRFSGIVLVLNSHEVHNKVHKLKIINATTEGRAACICAFSPCDRPDGSYFFCHKTYIPAMQIGIKNMCHRSDRVTLKIFISKHIPLYPQRVSPFFRKMKGNFQRRHIRGSRVPA